MVLNISAYQFLSMACSVVKSSLVSYGSVSLLHFRIYSLPEHDDFPPQVSHEKHKCNRKFWTKSTEIFAFIPYQNILLLCFSLNIQSQGLGLGIEIAKLRPRVCRHNHCAIEPYHPCSVPSKRYKLLRGFIQTIQFA